MGSRGSRVRRAAGIFTDKYGFDVRVKVRGVGRSKRFAFDAELNAMKAWQDHQRAELRETKESAQPLPAPARGTLEALAPRYLSQIGGRAGFKSDCSHLRAWVALYGTWPMTKIKTEQVNVAIATWLKEGYADQSIIHRKRVLREMYQILFGKKAHHPIEDSRRVPKPSPQPVYLSNEIIMAVDVRFRAMNLPVEYAIFRVLATTGQRPCQLNRAKPIDVNLKTKVWMVRPAKGEKQHPIYLGDEMIAAWKLFATADAWGKVDTCKQARLMRRCGWPKDIRPYNMRHSVAFSAMERGADIGDIQLLLGHHQIETTRLNYATGQEVRMRQMSQLLNGRLG